ncbi:hypothetical protein N599_26225 [Saccharopolyspora erythraea D]|nr:hypothetical protein N599_26225 [Saccharopolyspora erythraea D]
MRRGVHGAAAALPVGDFQGEPGRPRGARFLHKGRERGFAAVAADEVDPGERR